MVGRTDRNVAPDDVTATDHISGMVASEFMIDCPPFERIAIFRGDIPLKAINQLDALAHRAWPAPFQDHSWLSEWHERLGSAFGCQPVTVIGHHADQPMLALRLATGQTLNVRHLSWLGHQGGLSDYGCPIIHRELLPRFTASDAARLVRRIAQVLGNIDLVHLPRQPIRLGEYGNPFVQPGSPLHHASSHAIRLAETWEAFYNNRRGSKSRQRLKKKINALSSLGDIRFRLAQTPQEAYSIVTSCLSMKGNQLAKLAHWNPFSDAVVFDLIRSHFATNLGKTTWAASLEIDDEVIAAAIGYDCRQEWLLFQMSMNDGPEARCSPGTILLMKLIQHCISIGIQRLDLSVGDESYKFEWCDEHTPLATSIFPLTVKGRMYSKLLSAGIVGRKFVAAHPSTYHAAQWLRHKVSRLASGSAPSRAWATE